MHRFPSFLCSLIVILVSITSGYTFAAEQEHSVNITLKELRRELVSRMKNLNTQEPIIREIMSDYAMRNKAVEKQLEEISVVLYSLDQDNMFTLASLSKQIAEIKQNYNKKLFPFATTARLIDNEISKLSNLKKSLGSISSEKLSEEGKTDLRNAVENCTILETKLIKLQQNLTDDENKIKLFGAKINSVNTYAEDQIDKMIRRMFIEPSSSFGNFFMAWGKFSTAIKSNYFLFGDPSSRLMETQSIRFRVILILLSSFIFSFGVFALYMKRKVSKQQKIHKKNFYIFGSSLALLSILFFFSKYLPIGDFVKNTIQIAAEFMIISALSIVALTIRLNTEKILTGIKFYFPSIFLCLFFVLMRMGMVPNIVVNVLLPFVFPLMVVFQFITLLKYRSALPRLDRGFGTSSLILLILSSFLCWSGYSFMAFIINLVWTVFILSILMMNALWSLLHQYQKKRSSIRENANKILSPFISKLLFPLLGILMIVFSCFWPASIFDITHVINEWAATSRAIPKIINNFSFDGLIGILIAGIILNYLIFTTKNIIKDIYQDSYEIEAVATYVTLGRLVLWAIFSIISLAFLGVNFSGILVVMGGMSVGIGLALKDTIDNVICGLSLIFGRLKQGDVVECDGIRGKVSSVGFRTTFIETLDGSIIGFQNNQLFNKNFRNLTKNHLYESVKVEIGIAYGTDVQKARELILSAINQVETLPKSRTSSVVLDSFGDNSVNLGVWVWVPVRNKPATLSRVRECIYQSFNESGINIPFPQRDIYIKEMPAPIQFIEEK